MNDLDSRIIAAFLHIYPDLTASRLYIQHRKDETIVVYMDDDRLAGFRAVIHSDDDGYLRFTPFNEDDSPEDDDHDFLSIRVRIADKAKPPELLTANVTLGINLDAYAPALNDATVDVSTHLIELLREHCGLYDVVELTADKIICCLCLTGNFKAIKP